MNTHSRRLGIGMFLIAVGCAQQEPRATETFYDRTIDPVLKSGCATSPTGSACHLLQDSQGNALGNLSLDSFDGINARRDLLVPYGPYAIPSLLLKALPPFEVPLTTWDSDEPTYITTDIAHAGGALLEVTSVSYSQVQSWINRGATENNALPASDNPASVAGRLSPCSPTPGDDGEFDQDLEPEGEDYALFDPVNEVLGQRCGAGNCHGSPGNSMYLTCGGSDEQKRWNYFVVGDYVSRQPRNSEILRRALDPVEGGTYHEGGTLFETGQDQGYQDLLTWAEAKGGPTRLPDDPGFEYFSNRVQPMLVKRGCMQLGCHAPSMGHEYRLHGGSAGHFSLPATRRNYELSLEQVALESNDPNASRIVRKNLPPGSGGGILHRGGSLFAGSGSPAECDFTAADTGPLDEQDPYCVIASWINQERARRLPGDPGMVQIVYVTSPPGTGPTSLQDFEQYAPGHELLRVSAQLDAEGWPTVSSTPENLLPSCGLNGETIQVRRPAVSWDGQRIAFAARAAATEAFQVYVADSEGCAVEPLVNAPAVNEDGDTVPDNGQLVHNFDPTFDPNGQLVFASTRGNVTNTSAFGYQGPQRSPADPRRLNANLYIVEGNAIRQLTFLLDQELAPSFMADGRLIFTAEKRSPNFYQLAGRRMNLDGGDYHPLFGQRSTIGFEQFSEVIELSDRNLVAVVSEAHSDRGAGTLAIVNRSLGIDQKSDNPLDYVVDPSAMDYPNEAFYQHSLELPDPGATGRLTATRGAYLNPSALPNGKLLVSYAPDATNLNSITGNFNVHSVDPVSGERRALIESDRDVLWAAAVFAKAPRAIFRSRLDEPNGATHVYTDDERHPFSDITYLDLDLLATLLFQNTRSGRPLPEAGSPVEFWEQLPPESGVTSYDNGAPFVTTDDYGSVYVRRQRLGQITPNPNDGSARIRIRGGIPFNLAVQIQLDGDDEATLHHQREANQFYPGESARQSFPRDLFNGVCGNCHGSVSGLEADVAANPDILTQASNVAARDAQPLELLLPDSPEGPDFP